MDQEKQELYRRKLLEAREEAREMLARLGEEARAGLREGIGELSLSDNHPGDVATETFERSKNVGLADLARRRLRKIEEALARLERGEYGKCGSCGEEIPEERLAAVPEARFCLSCRRDEERARPVEEEVLSFPPGEVSDRGEAWSEVARFGTSSDTQGDGAAAGEQDPFSFLPVRRGRDGMFYAQGGRAGSGPSDSSSR